MVDKSKVVEAVAEARDGAKERNFIQSVDLAINLKGVDLSKPENRFSTNVILPNGKGKAGNVLIIADAMIEKAREIEGAEVLSKAELGELDEQKGAGLLKYDVLLAEAPLMVEIGQRVGPVLAPKGKMPKPFAPGSDLEDLVMSASKTIVLAPKKPLIHAMVGRENMDDEQVAENIRTILDSLEKNLPKGRQQIGSVYVKLTMGPSIRVI